jgi:hypothetical protein
VCPPPIEAAVTSDAVVNGRPDVPVIEEVCVKTRHELTTKRRRESPTRVDLETNKRSDLIFEHTKSGYHGHLLHARVSGCTRATAKKHKRNPFVIDGSTNDHNPED